MKISNLFIHNEHGDNKISSLEIEIITESLLFIMVLQYLIQTPIPLHSMIFCMHIILKGTSFLFFNSIDKITPLLTSFLTQFL